jgi:hypothetical protein
MSGGSSVDQPLVMSLVYCGGELYQHQQRYEEEPPFHDLVDAIRRSGLSKEKLQVCEGHRPPCMFVNDHRHGMSELFHLGQGFEFECMQPDTMIWQENPV